MVDPVAFILVGYVMGVSLGFMAGLEAVARLNKNGVKVRTTMEALKAVAGRAPR